ncbi:hypothetical protein POM88_041826 [Heracleum sosnowskyi]|uniref:F-box protein n=1 Tax=Heracleum sosnowskyi TaxID=360622 RepID=A0AAD8HHI4_9APIA|nr:hypothetical protein POM88_041826 [Heracleum sosnowskyi]
MMKRNILKRLTAKDLCKMSTLSSIWKDLLNDAHLINLYRAWSQTNPLLLIVTQLSSVQNHSTGNNSEEVDLLLTSMDPTDVTITYQARTKVYKDVKVLSSGRGCLFCILSMGDVIIFNATTKEIQKLPKSVPPSDGPLRANLMQLPRRPHRSVDHPPFVIATGFGYIESKHVYAVIKLFFFSSACQILLLSETGEMITPWRTLVEKYSRGVFPASYGTMVQSKCYWLNRHISPARWSRISASKMSILCLDIEPEMFCGIRYPNFGTCDEAGKEMHLENLKDELFLGLSHGDSLAMDIWVLKDHKNSDWNMQYHVDFSLIGGIDDHHVPSKVKLIGCGEGEQGGVLIFYDSRQQVLLYFNVEERRFKKGKRIQVEGNGVNMLFPYNERFSSARRPAR